jgi:plastocyanin
MRHGSQSIFLTGVLVAGVARAALAAPAIESRAPTAADFARIEADLARVQQDIREQRQLIFQLMQMHDALLKYLQMGGAASPNSLPLGSPPSAATSVVAPGKAAEAGPSTTGPALGTRAAIVGKVRSSAGSLGEAYVYLDGPKTLASRSTTTEIKQLAKQFVPTVSVVQMGTRVMFPNQDRVLHNVFSRTPGDAFDLGPLKAGDRPGPVVLSKPGHVEVFCNIHSGMRADILVVPNGYWTRVRPDGSFQISGVPVGSHRIVLWGPTISPVAQRIDVTAAGATATFSADAVVRRPHLNKDGGAYGSYEE